ncbi:MAG: hypothetical protein JW751_06910 [Polyangiaceae bacterium]|nr:hypothetical protein [Polyangiaceae bacterium]
MAAQLVAVGGGTNVGLIQSLGGYPELDGRATACGLLGVFGLGAVGGQWMARLRAIRRQPG